MTCCTFQNYHSLSILFLYIDRPDPHYMLWSSIRPCPLFYASHGTSRVPNNANVKTIGDSAKTPQERPREEEERFSINIPRQLPALGPWFSGTADEEDEEGKNEETRSANKISLANRKTARKSSRPPPTTTPLQPPVPYAQQSQRG